MEFCKFMENIALNVRIQLNKRFSDSYLLSKFFEFYGKNSILYEFCVFATKTRLNTLFKWAILYRPYSNYHWFINTGILYHGAWKRGALVHLSLFTKAIILRKRLFCLLCVKNCSYNVIYQQFPFKMWNLTSSSNKRRRRSVMCSLMQFDEISRHKSKCLQL